MIVKILSKSSAFHGLAYNISKIDKNKGELMLVRNFGALQNLSFLRSEDYRNYLMAVSGTNRKVIQSQFHAIISAKGRSADKHELTQTAVKWLKSMGYQAQPYLIVFHKDTANNHVHIVSTRIDKQGKKISSAFENVRAIENLNRVIGLNTEKSTRQIIEQAFSYKFTSRAQFFLLLERQGYDVNESDGQITLFKYGKSQASIKANQLNQKLEQQISTADRTNVLKALFYKYAEVHSTELIRGNSPLPGGLSKPSIDLVSNFSDFMKKNFGLDLIFHYKGDKPAYGYTIIDHPGKNVFKGGEIMTLKELLAYSTNSLIVNQAIPSVLRPNDSQIYDSSSQPTDERFNKLSNLQIQPDSTYFEKAYSEQEPFDAQEFDGNQSLGINIADDIDDEAINGRNRRKKRKARTNSR